MPWSRCDRSQGIQPDASSSLIGMLPTPNASSTTPRTPRAYRSPYAFSGAHPGTIGTRSTLGFSFRRGVYVAFWDRPRELENCSSASRRHSTPTPSCASGGYCGDPKAL